MKKILVVVDMQNDFIDGSLGTAEAQSIIKKAAEKITTFGGDIYVTFDTHTSDYLSTGEGKLLPVEHCIEGTKGWELNKTIEAALCKKEYTAVKKPTFGSTELVRIIGEKYDATDIEIELIGLCTDICVISNALLLKASFYETPISVDASCCAGVTPKKHESALDVMRSCQINI